MLPILFVDLPPTHLTSNSLHIVLQVAKCVAILALLHPLSKSYILCLCLNLQPFVAILPTIHSSSHSLHIVLELATFCCHSSNDSLILHIHYMLCLSLQPLLSFFQRFNHLHISLLHIMLGLCDFCLLRINIFLTHIQKCPAILKASLARMCVLNSLK